MHLASPFSLYTLFQPSEIAERFLATEGCHPQKPPLLYWNLQVTSRPVTKLRISIVQYLNTAPLVWGFTNGPLHGKYDLSFTVPSQCSENLRTGRADVAIIPAIEYQRTDELVILLCAFRSALKKITTPVQKDKLSAPRQRSASPVRNCCMFMT